MVRLEKTLEGSILDVGGGGEGVIGRLYTDQVTAIDNRQEELDEAPGGYRKLLMDAGALAFADASFDHVTAFYTLMYVEKDQHEKVVREACRVLRPGGLFSIWDARIVSADPQPFVAELDVLAGGRKIHVTYGVRKRDAAQDAGYFVRLCEACGLCLTAHEEADGHFYLRFQKK